MARIRRFLKRIQGNQRGQSSIEYVLMLLIVVMVVMQLKKQLGGTMNNAVQGIDNKIQQELMQGL